MPNKRTKNASKSSTTSNTKNQPSISKYFISDSSSYPTSFLRKRHAVPEADKVSIKRKTYLSPFK